MSNVKNKARLRRAKTARAKIRTLGVPSLSIHRTDKNLYAQILSGDKTQTLASASSIGTELLPYLLIPFLLPSALLRQLPTHIATSSTV